jgi:hypothetical protein
MGDAGLKNIASGYKNGIDIVNSMELIDETKKQITEKTFILPL